MTEQQSPEDRAAEAPERRVDDPFAGVVADLTDLGRAWARHGLDVGQQALIQAARTLELTATTLGRVAERLRPPG